MTTTQYKFGGAVKMVTPYTVRGRAVVFGGQDLTGEYFTADTNFGTRPIVGAPAYYDHALGGIKSQIGTVKAWEPTDDGIDVEIELDRRHKYFKEFVELVEAKALGISTGTASHLSHRHGPEIKAWPLVEVSLTPTPAEPRTYAEATTKGKPARDAAGTGLRDTETASRKGVNTMGKEVFTREEVDQIIDARVDARIKALAGEPVGDGEGTWQPDASNTPAVKRVTDRGFSNEPFKALAYGIYHKDAKHLKSTLLAGSVTGSYLLPIQLDRTIVQKKTEAGLINKLPIDVVNIDGIALDVPIEDVLGAFGTRTEVQAANFAEDSFAKPTITTTRYNRSFKMSKAFRKFALPDFERQLQSSIERSHMLAMNAAIMATLVARVTNIVDMDTTTGVSVDDVEDIFGALPDGYDDVDGECGWAMRRATLTKVKRLAGNPLIFANHAGEGFRDLLSSPVATTNEAAALAASAKSIFFGNWTYVKVVQSGQMEISYNPYVYEESYTDAVFVNHWFAAYLTVPEAFVVGRNAAS